MKTIYWFRRDLRLKDNRALTKAVSRSNNVVAIYIFDVDDIQKLETNVSSYKFVLLLNLLRKLGEKIKLHVFYGKTKEIFEELIDKHHFNAVYTAKPLSWIEKEKVDEVKKICLSKGVEFVEVFDNVLVNLSLINSSSTFTRFYNQWQTLVDIEIISEPQLTKFSSIDAPDVEEFLNKYRSFMSRYREFIWSVEYLEERLNKFDFSKYSAYRDYPYVDGTSKLSPYITLGAVSIRELYVKTVNYSKEFVRQLAWREYYYHLMQKYPWMKELELKPHMRKIKWENDSNLLKAFVEGRTGYPIIDAGIRQLKNEAWIHNRIRLVLASFLTKDMYIDWRIGEKFFEKYLVDYDEVVNAGNWQWSASVGVDPLPFREFNPITQAKKYDPHCLYIKKYIPELEGYECRELVDPLKHKLKDYHEPVVNHYERIKKFKEIIKNLQ